MYEDLGSVPSTAKTKTKNGFSSFNLKTKANSKPEYFKRSV